MKKLISGVILVASLVGAGISSKLNVKNHSHDFRKEFIPTTIVSDGVPLELKVPVYSFDEVPAGYCARYARLVAESLFEEKFVPENAWNLRYSNKVVKDLDRNNLANLIRDGEIKPGMILGIYNPNSLNNLRSDKSGRKIKYSHVGLYLGTNSFGEGLVAHQYIKDTKVESISDLELEGLILKEVIAPKD
ncbi:hypothetical protein COU54_01185 [Candidatus Pacearchaeota archaeon CG10_big_fil_rev_8_21_14_0_10_31_24]|nr:MAG: hypothetical protein COU54_01185 [Candidatus Pacearchaeota archaeon CG10_big_fil_rev_8_21_14_0_10_31_24]